MLCGALAAYAVDRRDRQPVDRRRSPAPLAGGAARRSCTPSSCSPAARTSSPPAWWCCSSASASRRCSARPTCRPTSPPFEPCGHPGAVRASPGSAPIFFDQDPLTYLSYVARAGRCGGCSSAAGGACCCGPPASAPRCSPPTATASMPIQYAAVIVGGVLAGIGGAQLSTAYTNAWFENMVQGRGFVAVAVVIFAARQPVQGRGRRLPVRRRPRPLAGAAGPRLRHQPVRPRRHPLRA